MEFNSYYTMVEQQFIHVHPKANKVSKSGKHMIVYPVILVQNTAFGVKALTIAVTSLKPGLNVYAYSLVSITMAALQFRHYTKHSRGYYPEVKFYRLSTCLEIAESLLLLVFSVYPELMNNFYAVLVFTVLLILYIITEILVILGYWYRTLRTLLRKRKLKNRQNARSKT